MDLDQDTQSINRIDQDHHITTPINSSLSSVLIASPRPLVQHTREPFAFEKLEPH
jgi:hypothetical protein